MGSAKLPTAHLSPGMLPKEELFWHWRHGISPYFESVPLVDPRDPPVTPDIRQYHVGGFLYFDTTFSRQKFIRDPDWLRRNDDVDHILLQSYQRGRLQVENGGRGFSIRPGEVGLLDLGKEIHASASDAEILSVMLPRHLVRENVPGLLRSPGALLAGDGVAEPLFRNFMLSLREILPSATTRDAPVLTDSLFGLLSALIVGGDPGTGDAATGTLKAIQRHIEDNLGDLTLGTESLCARFRMSRATLFRLFTGMGGVRTYIRERRLMACFKALSSPASAHRRIFDVALDCGFTDASQLSSQFRAHFGLSPTEVRDAGVQRYAVGIAFQPTEAGGSEMPADVMSRWAREILTPPVPSPAIMPGR